MSSSLGERNAQIEKSSDEGVSIDSSRMDLAAPFWNFTSKFVSSLLVFPKVVQQ